MKRIGHARGQDLDTIACLLDSFRTLTVNRRFRRRVFLTGELAINLSIFRQSGQNIARPIFEIKLNPKDGWHHSPHELAK